MANVMDDLLNVTTAATVDANTKDTFMEKVETLTTYKIATLMNTYWFPILIPIGLIGNTLSFMVMIKGNNRKMSTCIYMAAISINDNLMMVKALHRWLETVLNLQEWKPLECELSAYFAYVGLQNSTYQVVAMTIDKFIAIKWPHKAALYSTPKRVIGSVCFASAAEGIIAKVYSWVSFVLNAVIPFTMLIYMNSVIVQAVRKGRNVFGNNERDGPENSYNRHVVSTVNKMREKAMKNAENQLTIMLLLVTTLVLVLLIPTYIRFIFITFFEPDTPEKHGIAMLVFQISHKLYHTNFGINFFLYCISGQKFRNDLKEILCCTRIVYRSSASSSAEQKSNVSYMSGV